MLLTRTPRRGWSVVTWIRFSMPWLVRSFRSHSRSSGRHRQRASNLLVRLRELRIAVCREPRPRILHPPLCDKKRNRKSQPERNSEKLMRREPTKRKEHPDNRTRRRHTQRNSIHANHPLAMPSNFFSSNMNVGLHQTNQKQDGKQRGCSSLIGAADVHLVAHHQR